MTTPLASFRRDLALAATEALALPPDSAPALTGAIKVPERGRGDLALPCFDLARQAGKKPPEVAALVAAALAGHPVVDNVEAVGPYVNVTLKPAALAEAIVVAAESPGYGADGRGEGRTMVIDFSSPNIAKPLAFHHIRSTVIGAAIARIYAAFGYTVESINYLGDWGKQFGILATGFARYGDPARRGDAKHLVEVYVKANRDADLEALNEAAARPAEAKALLDQLAALAPGPDPKKTEKQRKSLEKKARAVLGIGEGDDLEGRAAERLAALEQTRAEAEARRPEVEARDREARVYLKRLEDGEAGPLAEWRAFRETSVEEFRRVYDRMGITFRHFEGESFYTKVLEDTVRAVGERPGTRIDGGAVVVDLPYAKGEPPAILKTRDGTTLYLTRDIAAAIDRYARFRFARSLYVTAADQSFHFEQLFKVVAAMGHEFAKDMAHVPFGRVHGMSTRRGNVVFLDEVLDESVARARVICQRSDRLEDGEASDGRRLEETAEAVGVGAVIFADLRNNRASDYTFRWEDIVSFDGFTGPYVQYTHARAASILAKAGGAPGAVDFALLTLPEERALLLAIAGFPDALVLGFVNHEPSAITRAIYEIAQAASHYFTAGKHDREKRILVDDPALRSARLRLVGATRAVLARGLGLLGVKAPDAM